MRSAESCLCTQANQFVSMIDSTGNIKQILRKIVQAKMSFFSQDSKETRS